MIISIISAIAKNRVIGNKNGLPWHLPADFKYFKENTLGKPIIMGLRTFQSIGEKPLPNRKNIILNNNPDYKAPENCFIARTIDEALETAKGLPAGRQGEEEVMVCGGASVYQQFLPMANRLYLTRIEQDFEGDTLFPEFDINEWKEIKRTDCRPDKENPYNYSFVVYERKQ